jgi:hypothetical protein
MMRSWSRAFMPHDFAAYMPMHSYIYRPTRDMWPAASVNARVEPIEVNGKKIKPSAWIDENLPVEQMTWAPGLPEVIGDKLVSDGGWIDHAGASTFNLYRAPRIKSAMPVALSGGSITFTAYSPAKPK